MSRRKRERSADGLLLMQQAGLGIVLLCLWEGLGALTGSVWVSRPSLVAVKLMGWIRGDLYIHLGVTLGEMIAGLALGGCAGILAGLLLGRSPVLGPILRPIVVALYSVPLIALAPLFIMFFGLDMEPKIILVGIVVFFLLFFNTFAGVGSVDPELVQSLQLMGANRFEEFRKVVAPGCMVWIVSGIKVALPYSLVAATTGEMLASRRGLGFLVADSASRMDVASLYAALVVLMAIGLVICEAATRFDRWILRWRPETA